MPYAVVQTETTVPTEDQLVSAYTHIDGLVEYDARIRARGVAGVVATDLRHEDAMSLLTGLATQGIAAAIVEMSDLPTLPQPYGTRRLHVTQQALICHDTLDRPEPISWQAVTLIGAGGIRKEERKPGVMIRSGSDHQGNPFLSEYGNTSRDVWMPYVEIHAATGRPRWTVGLRNVVVLNPHNIAIPRGDDKPHEVVKLLAQFGAQALLNRGAEELANARYMRPYANRAVFEMELRWLKWLAGI